MDNDPGIISFRHCSDKNIYCINIPTNCPVCHTCLQNSQNIPIRVPFPFVRASQQPCSIIVKPTQDDFLNNYQLMDDLHIGITTSKSTVVSYNWNGISEEVENWSECLVVYSLDDTFLETQWDGMLRNAMKNDCWDSSKYNEEEHNCFSFIMFFIKHFNDFKPLKYPVETKEDFTKFYIAHSTINAYKYICLYRKIIGNGFHMYDQLSNEILYT